LSEPPWINLLRRTKIEDIIEKGRKVIKAQYQEEVSVLLKRMSEANVLSAVVIDSDPKIGVIGFVDVLDLLVYVIDISDQNSLDITKHNFMNLKWEGKCFEIQSSGSLVNISRSDPLYQISSKENLLSAVEIMSNEVHRLAVIDEETPKHYVSNIIAQSDIINFIAKSSLFIGTKVMKSLDEAGLSPLGVATVLENVNVISALRYMRDIKVSGLGVVDNLGRLVSNISASDLLGLSAETFPLLSLEINEFLQRIHRFQKPPVFIRPSDTVENLFYKMIIHKVHRVYIVDSNMIPTGVVSMTDIMQFLLKVE